MSKLEEIDKNSNEIVSDYTCQVCGCSTKNYHWLINRVKKLEAALTCLKYMNHSETFEMIIRKALENEE